MPKIFSLWYGMAYIVRQIGIWAVGMYVSTSPASKPSRQIPPLLVDLPTY